MLTKPKVTTEGPDLSKIKYWNREASRAVGVWTVTQVVERTEGGTGADGNPFKPYSASYARKMGTKPDLKASGRMLASMRVEDSEDGASIGPTVDYAEHVHALRPFMGLTDHEADQLDKVLSDQIDKVMGASSRKGGLAG